MLEAGTLLAGVGAGDQGALEELYSAYERRLFSFGFRLLGDTGLAEELVQETFIRLWRDAKRFDPKRGSADTFLFTIARRIAIDLYRRPSSRALQLEREHPEGNHSEWVATRVAVGEALNALSDDHREVLELLHWQRLTQSEAATVLGVPLGTVKTRAFHAMRYLRKELETHGIAA